MGDVVSGVVGAATSIFGANEASDAQDEANANAQANLEFQRELADRVLGAQLGTFIDSRGNKVYYDEKTKTWRTVLSEPSRRLQSASDREELERLLTDLQLRRGGLIDNAQRRSREGNLADRYLANLEAPDPYTREGLAGLLAERAMAGISDAYDDTTRATLRTALRTGTGGERAVSELAKARAKDTQKALLDAEIGSFDLYDKAMSGRIDRNLQPYSTMAARASNLDNTPFSPDPTGNALGALAKDRAAGASYAAQVASSGVGNAAQPLMDPNRFMDLRIPSYIQAAGGLFDSFDRAFTDRSAGGNTTTKRAF